MKTKLYSVIALFAFVTLAALPKSLAQGALAQPSVRLVYFLPNDRPARPDRIEALRQLIKDAQEFYADEMERHGYGRKTFRVETDTNGEPTVHPVKGKFSENHYYTSSFWTVWDELPEHFDDFRHAYLVALDLSHEDLENGTSGGLAGHIFRPRDGGSLNMRGPEIITRGDELLGGLVIIPSHGHNFERLGLTAHEIGHAFGLEHDFREGRNSDLVLAGASQSRLSECAAEWLSVSRFFNANPIRRNSRGEIELIVPPSFSFTDNGIRFRFQVTDPDGLHQAQLIVPEILNGLSEGPYQLLECKRLTGGTQNVEFLIAPLSIEPVDRIALQIIDAGGSITWATFFTDIASLLPPPKAVSIPDPNLAAVIRTELELAPRVTITDRAMKRIESLGADDRKITNLAGLEYATEMKALHLGANQITNYDSLAELTKLTTLYLWANDISDLRVLPVMPQLELLDLTFNYIQDVNRLTGFTNLTTLMINSNSIQEITPLAGLTNLQMLRLTENQISDVRPLIGLTKLQELHLQGNPIDNREPLLAMLRRNPEIKIYLKEGGDPLPVSLSRFRVELTDAGVILKWATESELDNAGFNILRSETKDGEFKVVNPALIQGAGTTSERHDYTWTDTTAKPNVVYYYQIEDISHTGVREQLATVRMRGYVSASGKLTTRWADLKLQE